MSLSTIMSESHWPDSSGCGLLATMAAAGSHAKVTELHGGVAVWPHSKKAERVKGRDSVLCGICMVSPSGLALAIPASSHAKQIVRSGECEWLFVAL